MRGRHPKIRWAYRYYDPDQMVRGKRLEEQLRQKKGFRCASGERGNEGEGEGSVD